MTSAAAGDTGRGAVVSGEPCVSHRHDGTLRPEAVCRLRFRPVRRLAGGAGELTLCEECTGRLVGWARAHGLRPEITVL